jgi:cytochrome c
MRMLTLWLSLGVIVLLGAITYVAVKDSGWHAGERVWTVQGGNPQQGRQAILKYGCFSCHVITGVRRATGRVGPKLEGIEQQIYIGGVLPNTPENMIQWIQNPQEFSPETAMPDLDVSEPDARDTAAYLYSQS